MLRRFNAAPRNVANVSAPPFSLERAPSKPAPHAAEATYGDASMRSLMIAALAALALAACSRTAVSDVSSGETAHNVDVNAYVCSTDDAARCRCERTAITSGSSVSEARAACAP